MATVHRVIEVTVQCGVPENNELVYNIHVSNTGTGFVWDVSYRFSQLGTLDHDIATGCEKMKDIKFPQIDDTLMQLLTGKKSYPNRLSNLNKYRALIEEWIHQLITRSHMMPHILTELVEDWFCLPDGPHDNWQPGRALSAAEQNALHEQRQMEKLAASRPPEPPGKLQGNHKTHSVLNYFSGSKQNKDREAENDKKFNNSLTKNENPLLKVRVQRGQVGRNGKVEYDIQIEHAPKQKPYVVSRSYSVFLKLYEILDKVHCDESMVPHYGGMGTNKPNEFTDKHSITAEFPMPPVRCNFGVSLNEAHLSYRTRKLDAWIRDVCCCYKYMKDIERAAVRYFLDLDLSRAVDISIQDRLAKGLVEAPRANVYIPSLIMNKTPSEISEVRTQRSNVPRATAYNHAMETHSECGGVKRKSLWETSSLASSHAADAIGKGSLFHGQIRGELTVEKLRDLQAEYKIQNQKQTTTKSSTSDIQHNIYEISNMKRVQHQIHSSTDDFRHHSLDDLDNSDGSIGVDRDYNDDNMLHIGMDNDDTVNKASNDQWIAKEFRNKRRSCIIS